MLATITMVLALRVPPMAPTQRGSHTHPSTWMPQLQESAAQNVKQAVLAALLSCATLTASPCMSLALDDPVVASTEGSPVAREVIGLVQKYYLDRTFGGVDLTRELKSLDERGPRLVVGTTCR